MNHLIRQWEILNPQQTDKRTVTIIGAGAVGSWTALMLAKMGYKNLIVYDFDKVSIENMNCQFYPFSAIGKPKVEALQEMVENFTQVKIDARNCEFDNKFTDITVVAVDSMKTRKDIYEASLIDFASNELIDARMGAEIATMYSFPSKSAFFRDIYSKSLYSDEEAVQERCTAKATVYTSSLIGGLIAKNIKDITVGSLDRLWNLSWNINSNSLFQYKLKDTYDALKNMQNM